MSLHIGLENFLVCLGEGKTREEYGQERLHLDHGKPHANARLQKSQLATSREEESMRN